MPEKMIPEQDTSHQVCMGFSNLELSVEQGKSLPVCSTLIPLQKKLSTKVEQLRKQVKEKDRELAAKIQCLEEAKKQTGEVNQRLVQI